jgi:ABC-type lipoprotein export system ATPase subunit
MATASALIRTHGLGLYGLSWPDLEIAQGEHWLVRGPSGSGKSTLLMMLAGLRTPDAGKVHKAPALVIGVVPQDPGLLRALSVMDNLLLAQRLRGHAADREAVMTLLNQLGIEAMAARRPTALSRGQQQRVAIARALLIKPGLVLADEPSANLDDDNALRMIELLREQARANRAGLVVTSHDQRISAGFERTLVLSANGDNAVKQRGRR